LKDEWRIVICAVLLDIEIGIGIIESSQQQ
jgi:hypothetical protein